MCVALKPTPSFALLSADDLFRLLLFSTEGRFGGSGDAPSTVSGDIFCRVGQACYGRVSPVPADRVVPSVLLSLPFRSS